MDVSCQGFQIAQITNWFLVKCLLKWYVSRHCCALPRHRNRTD